MQHFLTCLFISIPPWHEVELAAFDSTLRQFPDRHRLTKVNMDAAVVFTEDLPGFEQTLRPEKKHWWNLTTF